MSKSVFEIYKDLSNENRGENANILAKTLPFNKNHKIGVSQEGYPLFFITCSESKMAPGIDMELIYIKFNELCKIREKQSISEGRYTVIALKTGNLDYVQYFIDVVCLILQSVDNLPCQKKVSTEIMKLIELFGFFKRPSRKTILGLWAELFMIECSLNPTYLIGAWHVSPDDKFDFNDGIDKIEVKCTSKTKRVHRFSYEQLRPNPESKLLVASIMVVQSGKGKNIFQLKESILLRVTDLSIKIKINQVIAETLGEDFEKAFDYYYDYQMAHDTLKYYDAEDVPSIPIGSIPPEVENLTFDCDLSCIPFVQNVDNSSSNLYKSIRV